MLTPTDPVVTSTVVTAQRVPSTVRHTLNLESGLNDGLALPFVLFFLVLAEPGGDAGSEAAKLLGEAGFGALVGIALGLAGGRLHHHLPGGGITARYEGIYAIGFGLAAFGLADVTIGNGLIAAFVAGIVMGVAEHEIPDAFVEFAENVSAISQVLTFFVFGALIVATGYDGEIWRLAAFILLALLVARPLAIMISFVRSRLPGPQKAFIAWFGPKGVASMLFALFVLQVRRRRLVDDLRHRRDRDPVLDRRPRPHRHRGRALDRAADGRAEDRNRASRAASLDGRTRPSTRRRPVERWPLACSATSLSTTARAVSSSAPVWVT